MNSKRYIVLLMLVWACVCACERAYGQTDTIRYVSPRGSYNNDGLSWEHPKNRLQDAINDLRDYLEVNHLSGGSVYVAAGTYVPTESTEPTGGSMLNTSFKIYSGIHVYGGFDVDNPESRPGLRKMVNGKNCEDNWSDPSGVGTTSGDEIASQWDFKNITILTGNHSTSTVTFTYDSIRGRFNTAFPASSYHVVWFATNGTYPATGDENVDGHYRPLPNTALVDGCVISSGNASTRATTGHEHTAYGGGAYMVGNAILRNCIVERCNATLRGGGVYLDGGGEVEFCKIMQCQVTGVGVVQGYGGGACIDYDGQVGHSHIMSNAARCGGGLAICHITGEYPLSSTSNYSPFSSACVINNNTASAEGGGIYLAEGGTINHATVTANECVSPDVTYYGRRHGRTGGIYVRDCGMVFNSVFWGNKCTTNNDIQFATVRQVIKSGYEVFVFHCAFMNHDITDWTNVRKDNVFTLEKRNMPIEGTTGNYPCFFAPTVDPLDWGHINPNDSLYGAGVFKRRYPYQFPGPRLWHLTSYSALDQKGVQVNDAVQNPPIWLKHAHTDYGVVSNPYEPVSTLGALVRKPDPLTYALVKPQGLEGRKGDNKDTPIPTIFIDPNRRGTFDDEGNFAPNETEGGSWDTPIRDIGEAVKFFRQYLVDDPGGTHHFMIPALVNGKPTGTPTRHEYIQILMKQGTISTVGPGNYLDNNIRTASVRIESHMRLYGGYPSSLTGTNTDGRNPRTYKSTITANLTGNTDESAYENNAAHVIIMANVEHAIVDGFTLSDANTHNVYKSSSARAGAGVLVNNVNTPSAKRINMVGNQVRNCVINNCTAPKGAAVYVNGEYQKEDGDICYAELMLVNCVIRNNRADYVIEGSTVKESHGVITANGRAYVHLEHCDIVNNVGYPFKADSKTTDGDDPIYCKHPEHDHVSPFHGYIRVDNSLIFCNGDRVLDDRGELGNVAQVMSVNADNNGQEYVFGLHNMFDADLRLHKISSDQPHGFFQNGYMVPMTDDFMPEGVVSHFTEDIRNIPADSASRFNQCIFTRTDNTASTYPMFLNPARNVGNAPGGDKPLYGGSVSYTPMTTNPCVNAAYTDYYSELDNFDRSDVLTRDYGGAPDIGAIENTDLPAAGAVIYVTPDGAGKRDGSSWANAIAGNTVYAMNSGLMSHANAQGDKLDTLNNTTRLINISTGNPILTTDDRYQGGYAQSYITARITGATSVTTVTQSWTTETNVYDDGEREGETETLQNNVYSEKTNTVAMSAGSADGGFSPSWQTDSRYPYGELSGNSRSFWRSTGNRSPLSDDGEWNPAIASGNRNANWLINNDSLKILNTRNENYVSGLQYAVEKASATNKTNHNTNVQVWVGSGKYTDYKGYIMRDSVTVYGGFPITKYSAPGLSERKALMSAVVAIPKSGENEDLNAVDYETILQISDINPRQDEATFNTAAKLYADNDYSISEITDTRTYEYKNQTIVHHYTYTPAHTVSDTVTATYMRYANMTGSNASKSVSSTNKHDDGVSDGMHYFRFGEAGSGLDCWHMSYPNKTNYVANIETGGNVDNKTRKIFDPETNVQLPSPNASYQGNWIFIGNGSLTGLTLWQTMPDVPAGEYQITAYLAGGYRNLYSSTENTKMYLRIYDANGTKCAEVNIKTRGSYAGDNENGTDNNRGMAYRYTLSFTQPITGAVKVAVEVEDGVRNTKKVNATYGTDSGGDPEEIPASYTTSYGGSNPNRREFWISNIHLCERLDVPARYELDHTDKTIADNNSVPHLPDEVTTATNYTSTKTRTPMRKRVLAMPDICTPTYFAVPGDPAGEGNDALAHTVRITAGDDLKSRGSNTRHPDANYVSYNEMYWDGFTIRHGFIVDISTAHGGGAGVCMFDGAHLKNCIVTDNIAGSRKQKGGGVYCEGHPENTTIENCFILNNSLTSGTGTNINRAQEFAGGLFIYEGTCFNSLIANNYSHGFGSVGLCVGRFYNNTVAYNTATFTNGDSEDKTVGGVRMAINAGNELLMANTIIYGNNGLAVDITRGSAPVAPFINCYVQSEAEMTKVNFLHALNSHVENVSDGNFGINNVFLNHESPTKDNTPFSADIADDAYSGAAKTLNNFALRQTNGYNCINKGTEDFEAAMEESLNTPGNGISNALKTDFRNAVRGVVLPQNDVVYANRVQDCQVDIGAYEFNAAFTIKPDTTTHPGKAIFYIAFDSPGGDASASAPYNAACRQKFQQIFDAAGRYKYALMTAPYYRTVRANEPDSTWTVEVWMEGDSTHSTASNDYAQYYTPVRSTKHGKQNYDDNTLDYSLIIPHGVLVKGGFKRDFYHYEDNSGNVVAANAAVEKHIVDDRDPLTYRTVISGHITSNTGAEGQCYHVVTFTDDLFDVITEKVIGDGGQLEVFSSRPDAEAHRAVLDGLFIEDGYANSPDDQDRIGAGAVVTGFAHIRNCVVQNNEALEYGGGLYLKPNALVSGTIVRRNSSSIGAGVYFEPLDAGNAGQWAYMYSSTICDNTAAATAGGIWFDNTNARVRSTVVWHNHASDYANVSGNFSRTSSETDYPFNYCGIESRRLEGQCNVEISPTASAGVRWDYSDPFNALMYYPIEQSSVLARAGMTYSEWYKARNRFCTLDSIDIAGVCRVAWTAVHGTERGFAWGSDTLVTKQNDFIEIGARALNKPFQVNVDPKYVMRRLFVMHTDMLNTDAARALQQNTADDDNANMYRQMGSCVLNPFHRLGDALDYIIAARKADPVNLRNARFEIYVEQGTYYPYHNAYGEQGQVRNNTFLIPEATTIIGGIDSKAAGHNYCQAGYIDRYTNTKIGNGSNFTVAGYTMDYALSDSIRLCDSRHRPMRDINLNTVIEPWEMERQTILSGNAVSGEDFTHVYHVITIHADSSKVGPQPFKYRTENAGADWEHGGKILTNPISQTDADHFAEECERSRTARAVILDGIHVVGGYANHLEPRDTVAHAYQKKTYFQGGGIFVDGNWTQSFDVDDGHIPVVTQQAKYNIPLVVRNTYFHDNMAGNGGAIYSNGDVHVYSCHFTQNYSQGPMTKLDQRFIPWSAGGCIASNSYCGIVNTLFDNNEARRGMYAITAASNHEYIPDADARQGFGGALSISQTSQLRVENCHFMRNKAVAYSAIYNFLANSHYGNRDSIQAVFNTMFWGNEVFEVESIGDLPHADDDAGPTQESIDAFNLKYKGSRAGVFHYDPTEWREYERLFHEYDSTYHYWLQVGDTFNTAVTTKLAELRAQGDKVEGLFYCSYRQSYGPTGMRSNSDGYLLTRAEYENFRDARALPVPVKINPENPTGDLLGDYTHAYTSLRGNNNVLINRMNNAADGPNFRQPSMIAGIDGYMQNADWLSTRKTITTDQGWGHLKQTVVRGPSHYITDLTGETHYDTPEEALAAAKLVDASATMEDNVKTIYGLPVATFDPSLPTDTPAMYNYLAMRASLLHNDYATPPMPCGDQIYMSHTEDGDSEGIPQMLRISKNPRIGVSDVYIDMGIYEYQYIQLDIKGNEVDTVWVAPHQREGDKKHNGLSWETPTADLQEAIDLVLSSHNNHDKYICMIGGDDGVFIPTNVIDNRRTFTINTNSLSPLLPDSALADEDYHVQSLTFLGGYSYDSRSAERNPQANPTIVEMPNIGVHNQLNQLFVIEDMTRQNIQANWQGELRTRDNMVVPVTFDGITFVNPYSTKDPSSDGLANAGGVMSRKGGAAIYYRWQRQYIETDAVYTPDFNFALYPDSAIVDNRKTALPKLTLSNCTFMDNGDRSVLDEELSPAVRIDHGGGKTLVVNCLFHSNAGAPIYSRAADVVSGENNLSQVPNGVIIVNSTFALNGGHITLDSESSELHNSAIWLDDLANDTTVQLEIASNKWDKTTNSTRIGIADKVTNNAVWGCFRNGDASYHNDNLATDNHNIFYGPYFIDPNPAASTAEQRRQRNFQINPGVKMMNMADTAIYRSRVFHRAYPDKTAEVDNEWWSRPVGFKAANVYSLTEDRDLGAKPRLTGIGMERGAFECQAAIQRVVYVRPTLAVAMAGDGSSWENAFGQGQLQSAIDVASVYTYFKVSEGESGTPDDRKAYVLVKGSNPNERVDIVARDGVYVYGSIPGSFNDTAWLDDNVYRNEECQRYINQVRASTPGVAAPGTAAARTYISSVKAETDNFITGFMLDGFVISNPDTVLESAPIVLNAHAALRNCIITGNQVSGAPLADVQRGLIYNSLFYGNEADTIVKAGANGLLLNNTITASRAEDRIIDDTDVPAGNIINNITHNEADGPAACFASYLTARNPYTLPAHLTQNNELGYQLHEHSNMINAGTAYASLSTSYDKYKEDRMIDYAHDRDLLGNPRIIGGAVDMGAFETWKVEPKQVVEIIAKTNVVKTEAERNSAGNSMVNAFTDNYGGHKYPHPGSVVYLMDSSAITMAYENNEFEGVIFRPGFMLMKSGASFYGNGNNVQMNYVAVEKRLNNQQFAMNAFPFDWYTDNITTSSYNNATDAITSQLSGISFKTYQYNGIARSAKDYSFQPANSTLWMPVDTAHRVATEGYLVDYNTRQDTLLRFNAFASVAGNYIYTEDADDKVVALKQHDNRIAGSGSGLNFTRQEDMGWNMKGLPWLVSGYRTDTILEEGNYQRQMFIPHVFYYMNADGNYLHMTDPDRIYAARSWDSGSKLTMGDAFLTQTATMQDHEDVLFRHPYFGMDDRVARPVIRVSRRRSNQTDYITVIPDSAADKQIEYRYGRDGVKWSGDNKLTSAYILDNSRSSQVSLLGAAPIDTDIPLGVYVPEISESTRQNIAAAQTEASDATTFSLPEKEAFAGYKYVYLIDYERHTYTNLQDEDYTVNLAPGRYDKRFALRIGGYSIQDESGKRTYTIFVLDGTLHIHGLLKGDYITVFAPSGQLITQAYSSGASFTTPLPIVSGYVVKVNDHTQKVIR